MTLSAFFHFVTISMVVFTIHVRPAVNSVSSDASTVLTAQNQQLELELNEVLKNCSEYCKRLIHSSFSFQCLEEIRERVYHSHKGKGSILDLSEKKQARGSEVNKYIYDFQIIYKDEERNEQRTLKSTNENARNQENAQLEIEYFKYDSFIFEPIHFLSSESHRFFKYQLLGEQKLNNEEAVIIQVESTSLLETEKIVGKIWVEKGDFSVMRMELEMKSFDVMEGITKSGDIYQVDSRRYITVEYFYKIEDIRFPSICYVKEALFAPAAKVSFPRAEMYVYYRNYRAIDIKTGPS